MRIISHFRDYYDCMQANDEDRTTLYIRNTKESESSHYPLPLTRMGRRRFVFRATLRVNEFCVGFCGKVYPVLEVHHEPITKLGRRTLLTSSYCFNLADVDGLFAMHGAGPGSAPFSKKENKDYQHSRKIGKGSRHGKESIRGNIEKYFEDCAEEIDKHEDLFTEFKVPIFAIEPDRYVVTKHKPHRVVLNPVLRDIEFFRVLDVNTAYVELLMFMNNLAVPQKPIPVPSDKDMIEIKGFDPVWGFRKPPRDK